MKDRVFIVWSGSKNVALNVKNILESEYNYVCIVGGNSDNNSNFSSVGDTVIRQMKSCNQAIVIFQNNLNGVVSGNLYFELGYSYASYGAKKVHCVKMKGEDIVLPSDFDNAFVEPIDCENNDRDYALKIVEYFMQRQKMSVNENKMFLIDNRYLIHEKILCHYSEAGSKCSDYELAQYILYYMQASQMFDDVPHVYEEILSFKKKNKFSFSTELGIAVNICLSFFELVLNIKEYENNHDVYIDEDTFFEFKKAYKHYRKTITDDDSGIFDEWAKIFVTEHLNFGYMLFGNNTEMEDEIRAHTYRASIKYGIECMEYIDKLKKVTPSKENHDDRGILALLRAYITRNMYIAKKYLGEDDAMDMLRESVEAREFLKNSFGRGSIDTQIYNTFCMEYYLALINYIDDANDEEIDEFDVVMYKKKMKEYLNAIEKNDNKAAYLHKLKTWCDR